MTCLQIDTFGPPPSNGLQEPSSYTMAKCVIKNLWTAHSHRPLLCDYKTVVQNSYQVGEILGFLALWCLKWYFESWQIYREIIIWCVAHVASKAKLADILWRLFCCRLIVLPSCLVPHSVMYSRRHNCLHSGISSLLLDQLTVVLHLQCIVLATLHYGLSSVERW